jgi:Ni/Co efflux regulator RcnB
MKISALGISLASILAFILSDPASAAQQDRRPGETRPPQRPARPKPALTKPARPQLPGPNRPGRPQRPTPLPGPGNPHRPRPPHNRPRPPVHRPRPPHWSGPHRPGWRPPHFRPIHRPPFVYPRGYHYHRWVIGQVLYAAFLSNHYYFNDYAQLGLYPPPPGYRWVRYGPDLLLVQERTGHIYDVIYNAFI